VAVFFFAHQPRPAWIAAVEHAISDQPNRLFWFGNVIPRSDAPTLRFAIDWKQCRKTVLRRCRCWRLLGGATRNQQNEEGVEPEHARETFRIHNLGRPVLGVPA